MKKNKLIFNGIGGFFIVTFLILLHSFFPGDKKVGFWLSTLPASLLIWGIYYNGLIAFAANILHRESYVLKASDLRDGVYAVVERRDPPQFINYGVVTKCLHLKMIRVKLKAKIEQNKKVVIIATFRPLEDGTFYCIAHDFGDKIPKFLVAKDRSVTDLRDTMNDMVDELRPA